MENLTETQQKRKASAMIKKFVFKLYIRTGQGQEFCTNIIKIEAKNIDDANKIFSKKDLPFHHFCTIEKSN